MNRVIDLDLPPACTNLADPPGLLPGPCHPIMGHAGPAGPGAGGIAWIPTAASCQAALTQANLAHGRRSDAHLACWN